MTLQVFGQLTEKEQDLMKTFFTLCDLDRHETFSSDTFRMYGLDRFFTNPEHEIGTFFAKMVKEKHIRKIGYVRSQIASNHNREIKLYEKTEAQ